MITMPNKLETALLIERTPRVINPETRAITGGEFIRVVRSYSTARRANEDLDLLQQGSSVNVFEVQLVEHIDD